MRKSVKDQLQFLVIYFSLESNYALVFRYPWAIFTTIKENIPLNNSQLPIVGFQKCT